MGCGSWLVLSLGYNGVGGGGGGGGSAASPAPPSRVPPSTGHGVLGGLLLLALTAAASSTAHCSVASSDGHCLSTYSIIPSAELVLGTRFAGGTEKHLLLGEWPAGTAVAVMDIYGRSKALDFHVQRSIAEHPVLGRHPSIIKIVGETADSRYIVNELAPHGSLTNYDGSPGALDKHPQLSLVGRLEIALQVLDGMAALTKAGYVFRDMAARNVLAFSLEEDAVSVKITDFGLMMRAGGDDSWPPGHAMGTRWMAPESLPPRWEWTDKSDVYSFGVLVWEVLTGGHEVPYSTVALDGVEEAKARGPTTRYLQRPPLRYLPAEAGAVYDHFLAALWEDNPANRPSWREARDLLVGLMRTDGRTCTSGSGSLVPWQPSSLVIRHFDSQMMLAPAFVETVAQLVAAAGDAGSSSTLTELVEASPEPLLRTHGGGRVGRGGTALVYSFALFSERLSHAVLDELVAFHRSGRHTSRANTRNRYSMRVSELGFTPMLEELVRVVSPLAEAAYGRSDGGGSGGGSGRRRRVLRYHHAHTVQRVAEDVTEESDLCPLPGSNRGSQHYDDADVTLNINVGGVWEGGGGLKVILGGDEGGVGSAASTLVVANSLGRAIMHPGGLVHQAELVGGGCRINLVVWCKWSY